MIFNHYSKIKRIIEQQPHGWYIKKINSPTISKSFKGESVRYEYYYRIYSKDGVPIKYCKFQQIDRLAKTLSVPVESLPLAQTDN